MAFEGLTDRLQKAMEKLRRKPKVTEADLRETMREIRLALLEADVNFKVCKDRSGKSSRGGSIKGVKSSPTNR